MKRIAFLVLVVAVLLSAATMGVQASPPVRSFAGVWESIDPCDGSRQHLVITPVRWGSGAYHLMIFDLGASACGVDSSGHWLYAATGMGTGSGSGDTLAMHLAIWCLAHPRYFWGTFDSSVAYDAATDTLREAACGTTTVWHRLGSE